MKKLVLVLVLVAMSLTGVAYAEMFGGKVVAVNAETNSLEFLRTNPETGAEESVTVILAAETAYSGVASSAELKADDRVLVEATQDATSGAWTATSIRVPKY